MKKILTVVGARPNFMKAAPFLRKLKETSFQSFLVHTGQHYDKMLSDVFFEELDIQKPDFNLNVGSSSHAKQTADIMIGFEKICLNIKPDLIVVIGDINSTMACAIVAKKLNIKVAHLESGLRSNDLNMPEEINRIITDSITDYFFVTEESGVTNLVNEGKNKSDIFFVGNLMIDNLFYGLEKIKNRKSKIKEDYGIVTLHRPSNVDDPKKLDEIISALKEISKEIKLFFSIHPRTKKSITNFKINLGSKISILEPQSYLNFLHLMRDAKVIFTDSGGIQEEATILKIPCYTIRKNTERPITITKGTNRLVGNSKKDIVDTFKINKFSIKNSYEVPLMWDGNSANRISEELEKALQ